ncbi:M23 family metallopeptidase [[Kitasatospora] papulosa]|uniref:M23 family metallopeptidase n=1 Tax=[Kitasatospora] papulosa TaxID=1464011 RepID=UPI003686638F
MKYFRQPIRPDLLPDRDERDESGSDENSEFGVQGRSRPRLRVPKFSRGPRGPRIRREPPLPGIARSSGGRSPLLGLNKKALVIVGISFLLAVGAAVLIVLPDEGQPVAGELPPGSTVTTFPPFPTASVMPPPDADEQPDGGVIRAPELTGAEAAEPDGDPEPDEEPDTGSAEVPAEPAPEAPAPEAPAPSPNAAQPGGSGSRAGKTGASAALPVKRYVITSTYAQAGKWSTGHHTGIDLAVPVGSPVMAVLPGVVLMSATDASYGHYVLVRHAEHEYTLYAHLSRSAVQSGMTVSAGQQLGLSGDTGNVTGPHLHFEVRTEPVFGSDIDPVKYLAAHGVHL